MTALTHSGTELKGKHWAADQKTVGKVAEQSIAALRERLKEAATAGG
jgi:hypothetical protein